MENGENDKYNDFNKDYIYIYNNKSFEECCVSNKMLLVTHPTLAGVDACCWFVSFSTWMMGRSASESMSWLREMKRQ